MLHTPNHILITGASGGVGYALALAYAKKGVHLSLFGRREDIINELAQQCRDSGATVLSYNIDVCHTEELMTVIEKIDESKPIDLVIANAGISFYLDQQITLESWQDTQKTIDVNLTGAIATVIPLIHKMRQRQGGQIAFISSLAAYRGLAVSPIYCASKAGLKAYGEALHSLLKKDNIHVSVICPGFIESDMSKRFPGKKPSSLLPQQAVLKIKKGLELNKANITFPYKLGLGLRMLNLLPNFVGEFFIKALI